MIEYVKAIFQELSQGISVPSINNARISRPAQGVSEALFIEFNTAKISEPEYLAHNVRFFTVETNNQNIYCLINLTNGSLQLPELLNEGIHQYSPSEALLIAALKDANFRRSNSLTTTELENNILFQQEDKDYIGHDIFELAAHFESAHFFTVAPNSAHSNKAPKDIGYFICSFDTSIANPNLLKLLPDFRNLLSHSGSFMKQNIFWAMTATHYKHVFLELYRCLENIYAFPHALALKNKIGLTIASYEIARHCAKELQWRRKEENSLIKIFLLVPSNTLESLATQNIIALSSAPIDFNQPNEDPPTNLAKLIYKIRNQMVHQFDIEKEINITTDAWEDLVKLLIPIIDHIYTAHASELPSPAA